MKRTSTVLRTRGGMLFQHQSRTSHAEDGKIAFSQTSTKHEAGNTYCWGWVGDPGNCFLQWVRSDNIQECAR